MTNNDREFIEALTASQEALRGYCYSKVRMWADAEDVLQTVNVKLWEKASEWDRDRPFLPWSLGVARFTVLSHFRDKGRERLIFDEDVMEMMEAHLQGAADETPGVVFALRVCMAKMADKQRELLRAHYVVGWSMNELAEATGKSISAVKSLLMRLRTSLAICVNRELKNFERSARDGIS